MSNWFDVDKDGLAKLLDARGKAFIIYELVQNAWDTDAKRVEIHLEKIPGTPKARLKVIDDDPEGFKDFTHAWTLYAESTKKGDPTKRGLFNEGEKMVLALCYTATISTTKGTVTFDGKGRKHSKRTTKSGSCFEAVLRLNQEEFDECCAAIGRLIPPPGVTTYFNREKLQERKVLASFEATLATTKSDENGVVRPSKKATTVHVVAAAEGETPSIYEMGIPIVETGDKWHIDVQQRVPLNRDRDNVTPAYLRHVRTLVLNAMHGEIGADEASSDWVRQGLGDKSVEKDAFEDIMVKRYGENASIYDPSDIESNGTRQSKGHTVVGGRSLSREEHANNRRFGTLLPSGRLSPTPVPFHEGGDDLIVMERDSYTNGIIEVAKFAKWLGENAVDSRTEVIIANDPGWGFNACYGKGELTLNYAALGHDFFHEGITAKIIQLLIHEFAHHYAANHLSEAYHEACCKIGGVVAMLALDNPEKFR